MLTHRPRMGCCATDVLPGRARLQRPRLVSQLGVVHLQRPTYGLALLVRKFHLRAAAGAALPNPRQRASVDVGGRAASPGRRVKWRSRFGGQREAVARPAQ
jgi:hypothetical protein